MAGGLRRGSGDYNIILGRFQSKVYRTSSYSAEAIRLSNPSWTRQYDQVAFAASLRNLVATLHLVPPVAPLDTVPNTTASMASPHQQKDTIPAGQDVFHSGGPLQWMTPKLLVPWTDVSLNQNQRLTAYLHVPPGDTNLHFLVKVLENGRVLLVRYTWPDEFLQQGLLNQGHNMYGPGHSKLIAFEQSVKALRGNNSANNVVAEFRIPLPFPVEEQLARSEVPRPIYANTINRGVRVLAIEMIGVRSNYHSSKVQTEFSDTTAEQERKRQEMLRQEQQRQAEAERQRHEQAVAEQVRLEKDRLFQEERARVAQLAEAEQETAAINRRLAHAEEFRRRETELLKQETERLRQEQAETARIRMQQEQEIRAAREKLAQESEAIKTEQARISLAQQALNNHQEQMKQNNDARRLELERQAKESDELRRQLDAQAQLQSQTADELATQRLNQQRRAAELERQQQEAAAELERQQQQAQANAAAAEAAQLERRQRELADAAAENARAEEEQRQQALAAEAAAEEDRKQRVEAEAAVAAAELLVETESNGANSNGANPPTLVENSSEDEDADPSLTATGGGSLFSSIRERANSLLGRATERERQIQRSRVQAPPAQAPRAQAPPAQAPQAQAPQALARPVVVTQASQISRAMDRPTEDDRLAQGSRIPTFEANREGRVRCNLQRSSSRRDQLTFAARGLPTTIQEFEEDASMDEGDVLNMSTNSNISLNLN